MLRRCWLGGRKGIRPVKTEWWGAGVVICLERCADLHVAQLMPLSLTVSCFSKIQIGFTFLVPADLGSPGQRAVKWVCGRLYAVGGRDGTSCLATVECYSPHTDSWRTCAPLGRCRAGAGVAACRDFIYAVGGHDSLSSPSLAPVRLDSVERCAQTLRL